MTVRPAKAAAPGTPAGRAATARPVVAARSALRRIWWYVREVSGESAYDNYLAHRRRTHPDAPALSRREFDALRTQPTVRCC